MARILLVHPGPDFSVADVFQGWLKALRKQGHQVKVFNTNDRLTFFGRAMLEDSGQDPCQHGRLLVKRAIDDPEALTQMALAGLYEDCYNFWPDVVFFVSAFFTKAEVFERLRSRGHKIVMLHTESPYQDDEQMMRGRYADLNLLNDYANLEAWADLGIPCAYIPHSYDPDVHYPGEGSYESDFSFIGTAFSSRQKFFNDMLLTGHLDDLNITFGGGNWNNIEPGYGHLLDFLGHRPDECVENAETARVYRVSKTGINFYRRESEESHTGEGVAMGPREIEMAACELFFVRDPREESNRVFDGILPAFDSAEDAAQKIAWWARHDSLRTKRAEQAREAIADRTFDIAAQGAENLMRVTGVLNGR